LVVRNGNNWGAVSVKDDKLTFAIEIDIAEGNLLVYAIAV
jgi:hypothetical protein